MRTNRLTVSATVPATPEKTWHYYTEAEHVINWNFDSPDWHCPRAVNDLRVGGKFVITMAAKNGNMSYDLEGTYEEVEAPRHIAYTLKDEREVVVDFRKKGGGTEVTLQFEPEGKTNEAEQRESWQNILGNFQKYVEQLEE